MHTNYQFNTNKISRKNNNNECNDANQNVCEKRFYYIFHGMKILAGNKNATMSYKEPSAPTQRSLPPSHRSASYHTAANEGTESANYNKAKMDPQFYDNPYYNRNNDHNQVCDNHYHHRQHQQYEQTHQHRKSKSSNQLKQSPPPSPPFVHPNYIKLNSHPNDMPPLQHHHFYDVLAQQQQPMMKSMESHTLKSSKYTEKEFSTDQHYLHYYSYHYNRRPEVQTKRDRKFLTFMTSQKEDLVVEDPFENYGNNSEDNRDHVLKEKMPSNNIITYDYDADEWIDDAHIPDVFNEGLEVNEYDKFKYDANNARIRRLCNKIKRKTRTQSDPTAQKEMYDDSWIDAVDNNNKYEYEEHEYARNQREDHIAKKNKNRWSPRKVKGKKGSPPTHRVLLYGSQSPHLSRISIPASRMQASRPTSSRSPTPLTTRERASKHNPLGVEHIDVIDCEQPCTKLLCKPSGIPPVKSTTTVCDTDAGSNADDDDYDDLDNVSDFGESCESDVTSDSEDGYRSHVYKLSHAITRDAVTQSCLSPQASETSIKNPESLLVPSLFPNVPPYLAFSSNTTKGPHVPSELHRIMKWRISNVMPRVVRCVLSNSGMRLVKKTNDWMGVWGKHMKSPCFKAIRPYQKINHLPGSFKIGRKDACWRNLQKQMCNHGKKDFGFMPKTYIIPRDLHMLRKNWPKYAQRNVKWIIKPPASARGTGIRVVDRWAQIPKRRPLIVQKYIERPLLINGSKFDLRLYVLVTSINPLRVFIYQNGLARFASVKYSDKSDTLNDRCMHLTNYSINKFSSNYSKNEDVNACHGHKWTIKSLWTYLANRGIRTDFLWEALQNLVLRTILAGEQSINNMLKINVESRYSCFELFGFDVLLDSDLIPWLLEVNISPSLHSELPLDAYVKAPLVQAVLNTALYHVPPKLSLEKQKEICAEMSLPEGPICYDKRLYINYLSRTEKIKHNTFTRKTMEDRDDYINSILDNLTPDDVRCLIVAEDELARSSPLERIFPTSQTFKYLKYNETPRYYNRLLDAWETRYANNRAEGIALLRDYCEDNYHLEVPPSPAKKYFEDDDIIYYMPQEQENTTTPATKMQDSSANDVTASGLDPNDIEKKATVFE